MTKHAAKYFVNKRRDRFKKYFTLREGPGITLTTNEIKDVFKVIKSLENRGILLKGTIRNWTS